jgi:hypothetical protein
MWRCVVAWVVSDVSKERSAFVFKCQAVESSEINILPSSETSGTAHRTTQRYVPEELNSKQYRDENVKPRTRKVYHSAYPQRIAAYYKLWYNLILYVCI